MRRDHSQRWLLLLGFLPLLLYLQLPRIYAVDLLFNGFRPSDLLLYGDASLFTVDGSHPVANGSQYLTMTNGSEFSVGRALYSSKVLMTSPYSSSVLPFSASFIFSMARIDGTLPGHGIAFLFSPLPGILGPAVTRAAQNLGLFNRTMDPSNGVVAVEFDVFKNEEFNDIDNNHVGVDVFSLTSQAAHSAGYWRDDGSGTFVPLSLNDGSNYQAWVDFSEGRLNVTMAPVGLGTKPRRPLISLELNLSNIFQKEMYVGFCGATGRLVESHRVLGWSFSNSNLSLSRGLITTGLPNFVPAQKTSRSKALIAGISVAAAFIAITLVGCLVWRRRWQGRKSWRQKKHATVAEEEGSGSDGPVEPWESEYWPHRIGYRAILAATEGFSEQNLIGCGGNGRVYKGVLGGEVVAVKRLWQNPGEEARGFISEVSTLGRLKHRNLVGLKGWCRRRSGDLILVYEYMENGSLDNRIFFSEYGNDTTNNRGAGVALDWATRVRILKDVAEGLLYLHEGWEYRVLHRDIKASNVMLDGDMVARLGDFGLARMHTHGGVPTTTSVVGTVGYMAPEVMRTGRATAATDVFGFGVLVLEVVCGRRAIMEERATSESFAIRSQTLVEWVWGLVDKGEVSTAVDPCVRGSCGFDEEEATGTLRIGLWCSCGDPAARPTMRQVVNAWGGGQIGSFVKGEGEAEGKVADAYLVEKLRTATPPPPSKRSGALTNSGYRETPRFHTDDSHPTFEVPKFSSSMSLLSSSDIMEGR